MILTTIFANCIALAVYTPYPASDSNYTNWVLVSIIFLLHPDPKIRGSFLNKTYTYINVGISH